VWPATALLLIAAWCGVMVGCSGGGGGGVGDPVLPPPPSPPPTKTDPLRLRFDVQPDSGLAGRSFGAALLVSIIDASGAIVAPDVQIEVALAGSKGARLSGTLVRQALDGVATFDDLMVIGGARGLLLQATAIVGATGPRIEGGTSLPFDRDVSPGKRHVILMVADGWGFKHIEATRSFSARPAPYAGFASYAMSTWDADVKLVHGAKGYDPDLAWSQFGYLYYAADSASTATAMYTGVKTRSGRIAIGPGVGGQRLQAISELVLRNGVGSGAVTSVPIVHATPAAWGAHNDSRANYNIIADEMLFGDPTATTKGQGAHGASPELAQVLIGCGHPTMTGSALVTGEQLAKARAESANPSGWTVVDRDLGGGTPGDPAAVRLLAAARDAGTERLFGLFGGGAGNLPFRRHDGSGLDPLDPTLAQMSRAALEVLGRQEKGFYLMIEGGAVDWASHGNNMSLMLGEMLGFDDAVAEVIAWIEDPNNGSDWTNTLLIVTGDHECGLLTAGPAVFPDQPLGAVTAARIGMEKFDLTHNVTASWDDSNSNSMIEPGEAVHWAWNTGGHSNCLIPCFFKGVGSDGFARFATGLDPRRGSYIDNTDVYKVMVEVLER
jgi:alkaline phosphatase